MSKNIPEILQYSGDKEDPDYVLWSGDSEFIANIGSSRFRPVAFDIKEKAIAMEIVHRYNMHRYTMRVLNEVYNWLICASIAPPDDLYETLPEFLEAIHEFIENDEERRKLIDRESIAKEKIC